MVNNLLSGLTFAAALGSGMMAGLFFVFSVTIMTALGRLPPPGGIAAMQSINKVILNPWFFMVFFGTAAMCLVLAVSAFLGWRAVGSGYILSASLLYLGGCIIVTIIWNVPLNNALDAADPASAAGAELWARYLVVWTGWNHLRTAACLAAAALFTLGFCSRA